MPPKFKQKQNAPKSLDKSPPILNENLNVNEDIQKQFEVELLWCIQRLQENLNCGKLNSKQTQETTKTLNTLMNNTAPIIKKRQLMRLTFGDYRAKMESEEKKISKVNSQIKLSTPKPNLKSIFVKKAPSADSGKKINIGTTEKPITGSLDKLTIVDQVESRIFHFKPSDNSFKFNFDVDM